MANIAHGDFVTIGAYASYWLFVLSGVNPILSLLFTIPFGFALGAASYLTLVRRVVDSPELMPLFMTFGLSTLISSLLLYLYSPTQRGVPISFAPLDGLGVILPGGVAIAATYAVVAAVALRLFLQKTFLGKAIRAVMENRASATLMGINPGRVGLISFGIGISIATSVGSMIVLLQSFTPLMGGDFTLLSFVIVVLGGLGSPIGALVGGVVLGVVENIASLWLNAAVTPAIGFVVLVIVLIVRPYGLMGSK